MNKVQRVLADNVKNARTLLGMSQNDLAIASEVHVQVIRNVENMRSWPGIENLELLAKALKCEVVDFFYNSKEPASTVVRPSIHVALAVVQDFVQFHTAGKEWEHLSKAAVDKIPHDVIAKLAKVQNWNLARTAISHLASQAETVVKKKPNNDASGKGA